MYIHMCTYAYVYMESCRCVWECTRGSVDSAEEPQRRLLAISFFTSMAGGAAGFTVKTPKCIYMHVCMYVNMYVLYVLYMHVCTYVVGAKERGSRGSQRQEGQSMSFQNHKDI